MIIFSFIFILLGCFLSHPLFAHAPDERPVDILSSSEYGRSFSGYGYLAPRSEGSEAGANWSFNFECGRTKERQYIQAACSNTISPSSETRTFISDAMRIRVIQNLQERATEYYAYQLAASSNTSPPTIQRPSCISADSPVWQQLQNGILSSSPSWTGASGREARDKRNAAMQSLDMKNMTKALMYTEYIKKQMNSRHGCNQRENEKRPQCISLRNNLVRLHNSFPALWPRSHRTEMSISGNDSMGLSETTAGRAYLDANDHLAYSDYFDQFKNSLVGLVGATNESVISTSGRTSTQVYNTAHAEGQAYWNNGIENTDNRVLTSVRNYTSFEGEVMRGIDEASTSPVGSAARMMYDRVSESVRQIKAEHTNKMQSALRRVCETYNPAVASDVNPYSHINSTEDRREWIREKRLRGVAGLLLSSPNLIRQALLDMGETDRLFTQAVLCETGLMPQTRDEIPCNGISGGPLPDTPVNVNRRNHMYNWPYSSNNNYTISRPVPTGPMNINLNISLAIGPSLTGSNCHGTANPDANANNIPDCVEQKVAAWKADAEGFLNCSTGQVPNFPAMRTTGGTTTITCPIPPNSPNARRDPAVKFNLNFNIVSNAATASPPVVTMHECFSANIEDHAHQGNCNDVKTDWVSKCTEPAASCSCPSHDPSCTNCMSCGNRYDYFREHTPWMVDRADSSNFPIDQRPGTLRHEVMHLMGAPDEYSEVDTRPYDLLADEESIMSCSSCPGARMQPRHLDQMLLPLRCMESQGGY